MRHLKWLAVLVAVLATSAFANTYFAQFASVRGGTGAKGPVCVSNTVFQPGEAVVWQIEVYDAVTGAKLTQGAVESRGIKVEVKFEDGQTFEAKYGAHPPSAPAANQDHFWTTAWDIPADAATGTYNYTVIVSDNAGHTDTFSPIGQDVGLNQLTVAKPQT